MLDGYCISLLWWERDLVWHLIVGEFAAAIGLQGFELVFLCGGVVLRKVRIGIRVKVRSPDLSPRVLISNRTRIRSMHIRHINVYNDDTVVSS